MLSLDLVLGPWALRLSLGPTDDDERDDGERDIATDHPLADPWPVGFAPARPLDEEDRRA